MKSVSGRNNMGPMQGFVFFDGPRRREAAGGDSCELKFMPFRYADTKN
jgi:hypothetical protein